MGQDAASFWGSLDKDAGLSKTRHHRKILALFSTIHIGGPLVQAYERTCEHWQGQGGENRNGMGTGSGAGSSDLLYETWDPTVDRQISESENL